MTATAAVIGTAQYLSPEQARGEAVDARSDVYATGCVLYELLCGAPPFTGDSPVAIAYQHVREAPQPPSETKPGLPKEMDAIVLKALNKNPLNRYQTAAEMRSDLVRALSGQAVQATPLMSDDERTELMRAAPARVGGASPPLLAPPNRGTVVDEDWEPDDGRPVQAGLGLRRHRRALRRAAGRRHLADPAGDQRTRRRPPWSRSPTCPGCPWSRPPPNSGTAG